MAKQQTGALSKTEPPEPKPVAQNRPTVDEQPPPSDPNNYLPAPVRREFELDNWVGSPRQRFGRKFGLIDLRELTLPRARALVKAGFKRLRAREK